MHTLHPDIYLTRRQRLHHVCDETGDPVWSGKNLVEALDWLLENDHHQFLIDGGPSDLSYLVSISRT